VTPYSPQSDGSHNLLLKNPIFKAGEQAMIDNSTGNFAPSLQCSLCGTTVDLEAARFECVTKITWRSKTSWWKDQDAKSFTEYSDPRVWNLALCRPCRVKSYLRALKRNIKSWGGGIIVSLLSLLQKSARGGEDI
jgi:hypothetical protein